MLIVKFPERSSIQNPIAVGHFKINCDIAPTVDCLSYCRDEISGPPKMLKHLTTDNHICRFVAVSLCVVICNKTNISREIVARPGPITRPDADPAVVPTITDGFQE